MPTTILTHDHITWTDIVEPTPEDIEELAARYPQFHPLNLQDCLTELEIPKLDHHDSYLFLVVHMPFWDASERISRPAEVDIFVAQGVLVTSHRGELKPLVELFAKALVDAGLRAELMSRGASPMLHYVLDMLVDYCFPIIRRVGKNLRHIEEAMFHNDTRAMLHEVAVVRRDIIALRSILKPQLDIISTLIRGHWPFIQEELDPYWGDIGDHLAQLCSILDEYAEVVGGLSETIDTLASHRIDEVVRLLTLVTILTLPITVPATILSMNIVMPMSQHPLLFYGVVGLGLALTAFLIWYLRRHSWL
jgi:magnesium transporter